MTDSAVVKTDATKNASPESLTPEVLSELRGGYEMSEADRACHNAVTNNEVNALALNREVVKGDDGHFSHRIKSKGITNQKKSGRCWMFAALNVMRPQVIRDHGMAEFEFSNAYLQFWDKLEKANLYLESIIELREADFLDREWETVTKWTVGDGGWWNYVTGLVGKYGVVPLAAMPETHSSANTATINKILGRLLRVHAVRILNRSAEGAQLEALRAEKSEGLKEIYRFLVITFGEPPVEFEWRYRHTRKNDEKNPDAEMQSVAEGDLTTAEHHTPKSFYEKYVGVPLSEFVALYHDPKNEFGRHYSFKRAANIVGEAYMHFVNIETAPMKEIAVASVLANEPVWFAVDMDPDQSTEHGLMSPDLFDYESLFGLDLTVSKADRARLHAEMAGHAMALMGVDLGPDGAPRKWLVENSWGDDKGEKGRWTLHNEWFDEHVYTIIVHQRHVPAEILERFEDEPIELPPWYPGSWGVAGS